MAKLRVLYDGWAFARDAGSPAAYHLAALLAQPLPDVEAVLALPDAPAFEPPVQAQSLVVPTPSTRSGRLRWEQSRLPGLARRLEVDLVHWMSPHAALCGPSASVVSPASYPDERKPRRDFPARLREALAAGGLARARGILWPADLPDPDYGVPFRKIPPGVHPAFFGEPAQDGRQGERFPSDLELPPAYVLYHGPHHEQALRRLLEGWRWAAGSIGESHPLVVLGLDPAAQTRLKALVETYELAGTVRPLPVVSLDAAVQIYQNCAALFHPADVPAWGDPIRRALACHKPVVALETRMADAIAGPAAYLIPEDGGAHNKSRALGAALITVVVEESICTALAEAARQRAAGWQIQEFGRQLLEAYQSWLSPR